MTANQDNKLFRFLDWEVYQDAQEVFVIVLKIAKKLSSDLRYTPGSQIIRSALSVILNISEGSGRFTDRDEQAF